MELLPQPVIEEVPLFGPVSFAVRAFVLPAFTHPWHRHPEVELTWILEGLGWRHVGDSLETFQAGDFCLIGAHLPHCWLSPRFARERRVRSLVVQFDPNRLGPSFRTLPELAPIARLLDRAARGLSFECDLGRRMRDRLLRRPSALQRFTALLEVLHELAQQPDARPLSLVPWIHEQRPGSDARLCRVLARLSEPNSGAVSQAECAQLAGLSPAAFSRFFRRAMGRTFQNYVNDLRLSIACRQLLETDRPVSEIAFASGFDNLSTFNRSFRLRRRMTPREFRRNSLRPS